MKRLTLLLTLGLATTAFAHDSWIAPEKFNDACGSVTLHMSSGTAFGKLDHAIEPERVARAMEVTPGKRVKLTPQKGEHSLDFHADVAEGITMVSVDLAPKTLELTSAQVTEYLDEIAATDDVRNRWKAHPEHWRESYTKHAKTYIRCGAPDRRYQTSTESGAEFIPQGTDPTMLKAGDKLTVVLLEKGQVVRDVPFVLIQDGVGRVAVEKPDANGLASFVVPKPGVYMIAATHLVPARERDVDWTSDFTTLTFSVEQ